MSVRGEVEHELPERAAPGWLAWLAWALLALLLALAFWLLLNACGLRLLQGVPVLSLCSAPTVAAAPDAALGTEIARQRALEAEIRRLELAPLDAPVCPPPALAETEVTPAPAPIPAPEPIPEDAWNRRDASFLEGCWNLDSQYEVRNEQTGEIRQVQSWQVCFDAAGQGQQTLTFDDGASCTGPMAGEFGDQGRLLLNDAANLPCSGGFYIYERHMSCERVGPAQAQCESFQPETGDRAAVTLRHQAGR